jgi:hypothetical protein
VIPNDKPLAETPVAAPGPVAGAKGVLILSAAATLILYNLPFLGGILARPLVLLSTVAHELGHGLTALLLGGRFQRFEMWASGAGITEIDSTGFGRVRQGLTLAGGLVGPAVAAAVCFFLGRSARGARACLMGLGLLLLAVEIFMVRNLFGFLFVGLVVAACFLAARLGPAGAQITVVFVGVQLALSVFSRADYLFTRNAVNPSGSFPSDVMRMQEVLFLPYWFWGSLCGAVSVAVLIWGVALFWRK